MVHEFGEIPEDIPPISQTMGETAISAAGTPDPSIRARLGDILDAAKEDYTDSPSKLKSVSAAAGALVIQGLDRARASVVIVPTLAVNVFENTHSPTQAALAAGAAFGGWCLAVGGATSEGLGQYPKAINKFESGFPGVVGLFEDSLPGFNSPTPKQREASLPRRVGRRVLTGVHRGFTVAGIGTAAYASTAVAKGRSRSETHKLTANASLDGGATVGAIVYGLGETILQVAHDHPELAQRIQDDASNIKLWYGVAATMMVGQFISNKVKKWRTT